VPESARAAALVTRRGWKRAMRLLLTIVHKGRNLRTQPVFVRRAAPGVSAKPRRLFSAPPPPLIAPA
jgi:hypothetical protein